MSALRHHSQWPRSNSMGGTGLGTEAAARGRDPAGLPEFAAQEWSQARSASNGALTPRRPAGSAPAPPLASGTPAWFQAPL